MRIVLASDTSDKHDWRITCATWFGRGYTKSDERREKIASLAHEVNSASETVVFSRRCEISVVAALSG